MCRAYVITNFYIDTDIDLSYLFDKRFIKYSKSDILNDIESLSDEIYEEYKDKTGMDISLNDFYNKFKFIVEISTINLNHKTLENEREYNEYLNIVKNISKDELENYLLNFTEESVFSYDNNLNLLETYNQAFNTYKQFSFSYKALFPDKYHVEKYNLGDKVLYHNEEYTIIRKINPETSIFESDDPLNYLYGYVLGIDDYVLNDDRFCYFPVDEDLISVE